MTLTPAAIADGYVLTTFATNFPNDGVAGPVGIAFPGDGVMVSDFPGHVRIFPTHADGQDAASVPAVTYASIDATGIAEVGGALYMTQRTSGRVVRINPDGTLAGEIVGGLPLALGIVGDPFTGHLFVATTTAPNAAIYDVDPVARSATVFQQIDADGLTLSGDGRTLYAAAYRDPVVGDRLLGFDVGTKAQVFDSGPIPFVDGSALGIGSLTGKIFGNANDGTVWEVELATGAQRMIASGGSRGDFVAADPADGTLLLTQTDRVLRLHAPPPCGAFGLSTLRLTAPSAKALIGQPLTVVANVTVNGRPVASVAVNATVTGANSATSSCTTDAGGTCNLSYVGSNTGTDTITASGSPLCTAAVSTTASAVWCDAQTLQRIAIDEECPCAAASVHGKYVSCVAHAVKAAIKAGTVPKTSHGAITRCAARSTCGKPGFVTCCRTTKKGTTKCSIKHGAAKCKAPKGGQARVGTRASCCDACSTSPCFIE